MAAGASCGMATSAEGTPPQPPCSFLSVATTSTSGFRAAASVVRYLHALGLSRCCGGGGEKGRRHIRGRGEKDKKLPAYYRTTFFFRVMLSDVI